MRRREFITLLSGTAFWPLAARPQSATTIRRVGLLDPGVPGDYSEQRYWSTYRSQMQILDYVEGRNAAFDARWAHGNRARLADPAAELVRLPVSVIVALSTATAQAAKSVTTEVPFVVPLMADPVAVGLVASLARPGGNVTGLSTNSAELGAKRLDLLREIVPSLSRRAIIWSELNPAFVLTVRQTEKAAPTLGVSLRVVGIRAIDQLEETVTRLTAEQVQGVIVAIPAGAFSRGDLGRITAVSARERLPATYAESEYVRAGGLLSYGPDYPDLFRRAATYTDKILKGARAADLPQRNRRNSNWRSMAIPQGRLDLRCRQPCSPAPTK